MSELELTIASAGHCVHPEHVVLRNGRLRPLRFPAMFALLEHPQHGLSLFDTGYSRHFLEATRAFPERLYALVTPVTLAAGDSALAQLARRGYRAQDVRRIFISHFHADHVSALDDFPRARMVCLPGAFDAVRSLGRLAGLRKGYLPSLIPRDFEARLELLRPSSPLPAACAPFQRGHDVFGDGSLHAVELPGHARGQLGLFVNAADGARYLLAADACWTAESLRRRTLPHPITRLLFDDARAYAATLHGLADLQARDPGLRIVPSHCAETLLALAGPAS